MPEARINYAPETYVTYGGGVGGYDFCPGYDGSGWAHALSD